MHARAHDHDAGLADALRSRTAALHAQAERTGIVHAILRGRATRRGYALYLRNLLPIYRALEAALDAPHMPRGVRRIARPAVYRASAIGADLAHLAPDWDASLPALPAATRYAERIAHCAAEAPERVAAHAYVRFLGDLNGGRVVQRLLAESLAFAPAALTAYDFPAIDDLERFRGEYRRAFDAAAETSEERAAILDEAVLAFRLEIDLANAVAEAAHG